MLSIYLLTPPLPEIPEKAGGGAVGGSAARVRRNGFRKQELGDEETKRTRDYSKSLRRENRNFRCEGRKERKIWTDGDSEMN